ncbi:MAG TPA: septum site-determining protein MinC [Pseudolabrys sp.]|jgi:septum site-determining protein MinC|nr:septum site-determining protein MinC [Pseudolabrys sp.]
MAVVLAPEPPLVDWVADIEQRIKGAGAFLVGSPVVLDLSAVKLSQSAIAHLVAELDHRGVRVMGLENTDPATAGAGLPPLVRASRGAATAIDAVDTPKAEPKAEPRPKPTTLLLDEPVRSGQSIFFPDGDVTVLGSVGSGAELVAGGSIHVYGALRGRAMAGSNGNTRARIFCSRIEAELLAIDGYYMTAESMDKGLRHRPVQAWLEGNELKITALD